MLKGSLTEAHSSYCMYEINFNVFFQAKHHIIDPLYSPNIQ